MGHNHKVFKQAVSEMKHFLLGSAIVLTLVAVAPVLAQTPPAGGGGTMPPTQQQPTQQQPTQQQPTQQQPTQQQPTQQQPTQQQPTQQQPTQQQPTQQPSSQQGGQFGSQQGGQQQGGKTGQFGSQQGTQGGQKPAAGEQGGKGFFCFSLGKQVESAAECDAADAKQGGSSKTGGQKSRGEEQSRFGLPTTPSRGGSEDSESGFGFGREGGLGKEGNMGHDMTQYEKPSRRGASEKTPKLDLPAFDFSDVEEADTPATFVNSVETQAIAPILEFVDTGKVKGKQGVKSFRSSKSVKALLVTEKQMCVSFSDKSDVKECKVIYKELQKDLSRAKTADDLVEAFTNFRDELKQLAGIEESNSSDRSFEEELQ